MSCKLTLGILIGGRSCSLSRLSGNIFKNFKLNVTLYRPLAASLLHCTPSRSICIVHRCNNSTTDNSDRQPIENKNKDTVVYQGPLSRMILRVKLFSLLTSFSGVISQPLILQRANELGSSTPTVILLCSFVGFFTFVTPLLLHYITKKYVTTVLYNATDDLYTATTYSLFLRRKELRMKPGDGHLPNVPGMFTSVSVRGVPLFIDAKFFSDIHHYKRIMGYDRPIDFKLKTDPIDNEKKE